MHDLPTPAAAEHRLAIATGISRRLVAARFKVSADAAWRHGREHLTAEIRAALATKVLAREGDMHRILLKEGSGVVEALKAIRGPLFGMFLVAIDLRQARVCDAGDRSPGLHPTEPIGRVLRTAGMGHEDAFPPSRLSVRCGFSQGTFAETHGNGRDAPVPDLPTLARERGSSTLNRPS